MSFQDKVVIVTGAGSGIGAATAQKFSEEGAKVIIVGRTKEKLEEVANRCSQATILVADVSNDGDAKRIIEETVRRFGKLDILINNAGIAPPATIDSENAMTVFDKIMSTNLRAVVYLTHIAVPHLKVTKGNIINTSSVAAFRVFTARSFAYGTSKAGLEHFTKSVALELAPSGIRVNTVCPGPVKTDIVVNAGADAALEAIFFNMMKAATAFNEVSEPEEIADLILFLASDKAKAITGASYVNDNGFLVKNAI